MDIAIVESNQLNIKKIRNTLNNKLWKTRFFSDATEFGESDLSKFDVIIVDVILTEGSGRELINAVKNKTSADLYLMSYEPKLFNTTDVSSKRISGLLNITDKNDLIKALEYTDSKLRIKNNIKKERTVVEGLISNTNGYVLDCEKGIITIGLYAIMSDNSKRIFEERIKKLSCNNCIIYFAKTNPTLSVFLPMLTYFYNFFNKLENGHMVFCTEVKDDMRLVNDCGLTKLFPVFKNIKEATLWLNDYI